MKTKILALLLLTILGACDKKHEQGNISMIPVNSVIIPLKVGNYWEFIDSSFNNGDYDGSDTSRLTISGTKNISYEGKSYQVFLWTWTTNTLQTSAFFAKNESDGLHFFGGTNGHEDFILTNTLSEKFPVQAGEIWDYIEIVSIFSDSSFFIIDTTQIQCISTNSVFKSKLGDLNCIAYQYSRPYSKMMNIIFLGSGESTKPANSSIISVAYYKPNMGYIGLIQKINEKICYKKTLVSIHLN